MGKPLSMDLRSRALAAVDRIEYAGDQGVGIYLKVRSLVRLIYCFQRLHITQMPIHALNQSMAVHGVIAPVGLDQGR